MKIKSFDVSGNKVKAIVEITDKDVLKAFEDSEFVKLFNETINKEFIRRLNLIKDGLNEEIPR